MKLTKRTFLAAGAALAATTLTPMAALAIGGNDPIPGIDVIVKLDPSGSKPIAPFSLTDDEMARFNQRKGRDRADYLAGIIAMHIAKADKEIPVKALHKALLGEMGTSWCGPCRMINGRIEHKLSISGPEFKSRITALITASF